MKSINIIRYIVLGLLWLAMQFMSVPAMATTPPRLTAGEYHTCYLTDSGKVTCWGFNLYGELGNGTTSISEITPTFVKDLNGSNLINVAAISAKGDHTCALISGEVKCWGYNSLGQLGNGTITDSARASNVMMNSNTPLSEVTAIAAGNFHTCAVVGGGVSCWGKNESGELGSGIISPSRLFPVSVIDKITNQPLTGVSNITAGAGYTCALINDGTVKCWGVPITGATTLLRNLKAVVVTGLANVKALESGAYHICALIYDGTMKCWGYGLDGELGRGTTAGSPTPVNAYITDVKAIGVMDRQHTCAIAKFGSVWCWGLNNFGQLGDVLIPPYSNKLTPVQVIVKDSTNCSGDLVGVTDVALGVHHTCALTATGTIRCWGRNHLGQLGLYN